MLLSSTFGLFADFEHQTVGRSRSNTNLYGHGAVLQSQSQRLALFVFTLRAHFVLHILEGCVHDEVDYKAVQCYRCLSTKGKSL